MPRVIELLNREPLTAGHKRAIYQHPDDDDLLIKVIRPDTRERRWGSGAPWYKRMARPGMYINFYREVGEYICVRARAGKPMPFLQTFVGFVETDMGFGVVVEKLRGRDGHLAPQLKSIILQDGLGAEYGAKLDQLIEELIANDVILGKFNTRNIVAAVNGDGTDRLVVVDGFGSKSLVSIYYKSGWANRWNTRRKVAEIRGEIARLLAARSSPPSP